MIETPLRLKIDLSSGWDFVRGRVSRRWIQGRTAAGETVDLPHSWNRCDTFEHDRRSYSGHGAYRRTLDLPPAAAGGGSWRLRSEGFYGYGDLWLDGRAFARIDGQYLGFDKALPDALPAGRHVLTVRLQNLPHRNVLPGRRDPDFLLYGGLAGRMWLEWVPWSRIDGGSVHVVATPGPEGSELIDLRCALHGLETLPSDARLSWTITTTDGEVVAAAGPTTVAHDTQVISTMLARPRLWSPREPHLYWAECRLEGDGGVLDVVRQRFGITRAEFRPDRGFFLDGERLDLHGCNRHDSIPGLGNALPPELHHADARLLKRYGCNFVRLSHYPQHPTFLDACDELGILVYAEIASWKSVRSSSGWRRAARRQMRKMILRDRHHPSVILWGMGNESRSRKTFLELRDIARELDPGRPVTYAENHLYRARREKTVGIPDVWAVNYELDKLGQARDASRLGVVLVSECCNFPLSARGEDGAELTQVATLEYEWKLLADRPGLAGHAVWCFSDYATEYRKRYRRQSGLFDAWRRPKMAAELFRARYADEPFLSLFVSRRAGDEELHVFTNCEHVRVTRDHDPPIELNRAFHHMLALEGGFSVLTAEGERRGVRVVEKLPRWGQAVTVTVEPEGRSRPGTTVAVDLTVVDHDGIPVRDWNGRLRVSAAGGGALLPFTDSGEVEVARGEGRVYLALDPSGGAVVITAEGDGLEAGVATVVIGSEPTSGGADQSPAR